jgi:hypothetical protein
MVESLFNVGDRVVVRMSPRFPTNNPRTPTYAKGRQARVIATYGRVDNPLDHHAAYEPLYTVQFDGCEVFGSQAGHVIIAELHEEWLELAD